MSKFKQCAIGADPAAKPAAPKPDEAQCNSDPKDELDGIGEIEIQLKAILKAVQQRVEMGHGGGRFQYQPHNHHGEYQDGDVHRIQPSGRASDQVTPDKQKESDRQEDGEQYHLSKLHLPHLFNQRGFMLFLDNLEIKILFGELKIYAVGFKYLRGGGLAGQMAGDIVELPAVG